MGPERACPECTYTVSPRVKLSTEQRLADHVSGGNTDIVAHMVLTEMRRLPDSEKRNLVATAAENEVAFVRSYLPDAKLEGNWFRSIVKKAKELRRSKREGKALGTQLENMFTYARFRSQKR